MKKSTLIYKLDKGIIYSRKDRKSGGLRRSPFYVLTENDIRRIKLEIKAIEADESKFVFNTGLQTGYSDETEYINICGDVMPDKSSIHPRDKLSERAVLAHEYYGHYTFSPSEFEPGDWRDEFRASYMAALNTPNLTDDDRRLLILDAYERAKDNGIILKYCKKAKEIIYGYSENNGQ